MGAENLSGANLKSCLERNCHFNIFRCRALSEEVVDAVGDDHIFFDVFAKVHFYFQFLCSFFGGLVLQEGGFIRVSWSCGRIFHRKQSGIAVQMIFGNT